MYTSEPITEARERVLDAAEDLFSRKGYVSVTLRDIAAVVGIRHTSLYHHAPGGKEQLFIEVIERHFRRHHDGLTNVIAAAGPDLRSRLYAVADWLLAQSPMDLVRIMYADMPSMDQEHGKRLAQMGRRALIAPIEHALEQAQAHGEIEHHNMGLVAGAILGMIKSMHAIPCQAAMPQSRQTMAHEVIDVLLRGLRCS